MDLESTMHADALQFRPRGSHGEEYQSGAGGVGAGHDTDEAFEESLHARELVRLLQCCQCYRPLEEPLALPCGGSLCRKCLPPARERRHITYPNVLARAKGFQCPIPTCGAEHAVLDCNVDVTLRKLVNIIRETVADWRKASALKTELRWSPQEKCDSDITFLHQDWRVESVIGGRFVATYTLAEKGKLGKLSPVEYRSTGNDYSTAEEHEALKLLRKAVSPDLDCQICFCRFRTPCATTCGHTFCQACLKGVLNHTSSCPVCRQPHAIPPEILNADAPPTTTDRLLTRLNLHGHSEDPFHENVPVAETLDIQQMLPIFVCAVAMPNVPMFLTIFEERYKRMMNRVYFDGDGVFGMVLHNDSGVADDGKTPQFCLYGTLLHIVSYHQLPNGRKSMETRGGTRFKIARHENHPDGYLVGQVEPFHDISIAAEEAAEAREVAAPESKNERLDGQPDMDRMSTQAIFEYCDNFMRMVIGRMTPIQQQNLLVIWGEVPTDPSDFTWWVATNLPTTEEMRLDLIRLTSVRERLKLCMVCMKEMEALAPPWLSGPLAPGTPSNCTVL